MHLEGLADALIRHTMANGRPARKPFAVLGFTEVIAMCRISIGGAAVVRMGAPAAFKFEVV